MSHDVFISYSSHDRKVADAACALLEQRGYRCWVAPRDILSGLEWGKAIVEGIRGARVFVLIFSANANRSPQVNREVERAVSNGLPIIPFRIEDVAPSDSLEYFISNQHWLDALTPPLARHLHQLSDVVGRLIGLGATPPAASASAAKPRESDRIGAAALAGMGIGLAVLIAAVTWLLWNPYSPPPQAANEVADNQAAANEMVRMPRATPQPVERLIDLNSLYYAPVGSRLAATSRLARAAVPVSVTGLTPPGSEVNLLFQILLPGRGEMIRSGSGTTLLAFETYQEGPASFTLRFARPVAEFRFTVPGLRPQELQTISFPSFSATAFDDEGNVVATARRGSQPMSDAYERTDPQTFILTGTDAPIRTVTFNTEGVMIWRPVRDAPPPTQTQFQAMLIEAMHIRRVPGDVPSGERFPL